MLLEERHEFIAPRTLFKIILSIYKVCLTLVQKYQNLERARSPKRTLRFLCGLPVAILLIYYAGITDTIVGWVFSNYLILMPSWPAVKKAIVLPEPISKVL